MSLNKFTDIAQKNWMDIGCNQIQANDMYVKNTFDCKELTCTDLESEHIRTDFLKVGFNTFPVQKYYTAFGVGISLADPEKNVLVGGTGSVSYDGDDRQSTETVISSTAEFVYHSGDTYILRLKRGGKTLLEFNYIYTGGNYTSRSHIEWKITTREAGTGGSLSVHLKIEGGSNVDGVAAGNSNRYYYENIGDDTTLSGDLQFTIQPTTLNQTSLCVTAQRDV